ncbi:gag/pol protein [Cucumis melo var. makuwa]|uniref:Gag/pol protein n=1 Tax=Cucumis melo var. makuwa TaxID=1194695 RepID=A0A5D3BSF2_CUCMM|nr:gag/pol protein [Cucumis melo var. makuwa]TYK01019.1 gag/pol protein [Cucumis melo var. makuwa]
MTPKNSKGKKVAKGKCYHCNKDGHWLRNCLKYLAVMKAEKEAHGNYFLKSLWRWDHPQSLEQKRRDRGRQKLVNDKK